MTSDTTMLHDAAALQGGGSAPSRPARKRYARATVFRSQKHPEEFLKKVGVLDLGKDTSSGCQVPSVVICPDAKVGKPWLGFGGSFTEAAACTLHKMSEEKQLDIVNAYFNPQTGLGYTIGRVHIGSCDFSTSNWTCGDLSLSSAEELAGFSVRRYKEHILPLIQEAAKAAGVKIKLVASPWTPPPWMKTVQKFNLGSLKKEFRAPWAQHYVLFVQEMEKLGASIWAVTVQNEPENESAWESCVWSAEAERDFIRDFLGPALEKADLGSVKILAWDHNRDGMLERAAILYGDAEAAAYVWGIAYHWYGDGRFEVWPDIAFTPCSVAARNRMSVNEPRSQACFENVRRVAELRPDKHILHTECCQELADLNLRSELGNWKYAERYAMNIIADVEAGCEGWIDWNLCLDEVGGPNHCGNFCLAPIILDTRRDRVLMQPCYHVLSHFSKFIRPGARRVTCGTSRDALEALAFSGPDPIEVLTVVVLNQTQRDVEFWLKVVGSGAVPLLSPAHSILSIVIDSGEDAVVLPSLQTLMRGPRAEVAERPATSEHEVEKPRCAPAPVTTNGTATPKSSEASPNSGPRTWTVVGGSSSGGIIVRKSESVTSNAFDERLATGAKIQQVILKSNRLCFKKLSGDGPDFGWVTVRNQERSLVEPEE
mmetsp:Transcript_31844/g.74419  ORF Transcript_31844/g.74419 Transcript_31844/m.74419 type:complete len:655 (+) Transcript_31844:108-2072(+)